MAFMGHSGATGWDIWGMSLADHKTFPVYRTPFNKVLPALSPDGRWVAFASSETGRTEIYITAFPKGGAKWLVSTAGGTEPHWRGDGKELYFLSGENQIMAVDVSESASAVTLGKPHALFTANVSVGAGSYDVTRDGKRFLILSTTAENGSSENPLNLVINWPALLKK